MTTSIKIHQPIDMGFGESVYHKGYTFKNNEFTRECKFILNGIDGLVKTDKLIALNVASTQCDNILELHPSNELFLKVRKFLDELIYNVVNHTATLGGWIGDTPPHLDLRNYNEVPLVKQNPYYG